MSTARIVLVTGVTGQVALCLSELGQRLEDIDLRFAGRPALDLETRKGIRETVSTLRPSAIISAAAYTNVDAAETDSETAWAVNARGVRALAEVAGEGGIPLVHLSTDYVFDGTKREPYVEDDPPSPVNVYGRTKLAGEGAIAEACPNHVILRTSWVFSPFGKNFVKTMLSLARTRDVVRVVDDQVGAPTSAHDIAEACLAVLRNLWANSGNDGLRGLFHMTSAGNASWADFAEEIFALSKERGGPSASVVRIGSDEYRTPAARPGNSRLDCSRLRRVHGIQLPDWRTAVAPVVERLIVEEGVASA